MGRDAWNIDAGDLRQQIALQTAVVGSPDSRGKPSILWPDSITAATWSGGVANITILGTLPAAFVAGVPVGIGGMMPPAWNGNYTVASVLGAHQFTIAMASTPGTQTKLGTIQCDPALGVLIRCKIETLAGRKLETARQYVQTASHLVRIRGNGRQLDENLNRLVYKFGRIFNIGWVNDIEERHVALELICTELKPEP